MLDPAVGNEMSMTLEPHFYYELISLRFDFTTAAPGVSRVCLLNVTNGTDTLFQLQPLTTHAVSTTASYQALPIGFTRTLIMSLDKTYIFPIGIMLEGGMVIETSTGNLNAGDQYSGIISRWKRWAVRQS